VRVWKYFFPKYRICDATIHKTHFFFHWIDLKFLYGITKCIKYRLLYIHTYTLYQSADILLQYISQSLNVTNIYYIDHRLIKIYKDKWCLILVPKHIIQVVLVDHVLSINVVFDCQAWLCSFIRALAQSCSLIRCSIEVSFIRSFSFFSLFEGFLVQVNQVLGYIALLCNMIRTITIVILEGFLSFP
jgi:hypothetical protein